MKLNSDYRMLLKSGSRVTKRQFYNYHFSGWTILVSIVSAIILVSVAWVVLAHAEKVNINAIIQIESGGDPNAYNENSGAKGLMQITTPCLHDYNVFQD